MCGDSETRKMEGFFSIVLHAFQNILYMYSYFMRCQTDRISRPYYDTNARLEVSLNITLQLCTISQFHNERQGLSFHQISSNPFQKCDAFLSVRKYALNHHRGIISIAWFHMSPSASGMTSLLTDVLDIINMVMFISTNTQTMSKYKRVSGS